MIQRRRAIMMLATTLIVTACGGGGASGAASSAASTAQPTSGAEATPAAPASVAAEATPAGGTATGVCDLVTKDELATAFGVPSVTTTVLAGPPDSCIVKSDTDRSLATWSYTPANGSQMYETVVLPGQSVEVPGIGDRAAYVDNLGFLVVKGPALLSIAISSGSDLDDDQMKEVSKQLASFAAGRM